MWLIFYRKLSLKLLLMITLLIKQSRLSCHLPSTSKIGDGKIFVLDIQEAIRVRTGEKGPEAL
jgi:nitrogen regulatory protein P-II 1